jgi:hypothetical protein
VIDAGLAATGGAPGRASATVTAARRACACGRRCRPHLGPSGRTWAPGALPVLSHAPASASDSESSHSLPVSAAAPCQCQELGRSSGALRVGESGLGRRAESSPGPIDLETPTRLDCASTDRHCFTSDFHRKSDFRPPSRSLCAWHQGQGRGQGAAWPGACTLRDCAFVPQSRDPGGLGCGLFRGPWTTALRQRARTRARYAHQM